MGVKINEATFQFAALREVCESLTSSFGRAPIIPSQRRERHDPWDASLEYAPGKILLLQFKASKCRKRVPRKSPRPLTPVFYEFGVRWRPSEQHNKMRRLALGGAEIYYVAPMFDEEGELHDLFQRRMVISNSIAVDPGTLPEIHSGEHHFCYKDDCHGIFCSEPIDVDIVPFGKALYRFTDQPAAQDLGDVVRTMEVQVKDALQIRGTLQRRRNFRRSLHWIAMTLRQRLGVETLVVARQSF